MRACLLHNSWALEESLEVASKACTQLHSVSCMPGYGCWVLYSADLDLNDVCHMLTAQGTVIPVFNDTTCPELKLCCTEVVMQRGTTAYWHMSRCSLPFYLESPHSKGPCNKL